MVEGMDSVHSSIALASCMRANSKPTRCTVLVAKYNQTAHIMWESGMTKRGMERDINCSLMDQCMKDNGEKTKFMVSVK